jgi:hypothetical protein
VDFLLGDSMQGVRFLLEFAKAEERLRLWGIRSTIVVLGSARIRERPGGDGVVPNAARDARAELARWYDESRRFGRIASERGGALIPVEGQRDNVITTGGGPGIMEAANRGAFDVGAPSIGFNIQLPREQEPNPYSTPDLTFQFHSFTMRKMHLAMRAAAVVAFPGGFGTLAELFEVLTLVQTRKARSIPMFASTAITGRGSSISMPCSMAGWFRPRMCSCCGLRTMRRELGKRWSLPASRLPVPAGNESRR